MYSGLLRFVLVLAASQLLNDTKKVEFRQLSEAPAIKEKKSVQSYQEIRTYMKLPHLKRTVRSYPPWPKLPDLTVLFNNWFFFFVGRRKNMVKYYADNKKSTCLYENVWMPRARKSSGIRKHGVNDTPEVLSRILWVYLFWIYIWI